MAEPAPLTESEAAVYDRQIRVWGVDTQQRLRSARVLFVGCTGVGIEAAKNVVLAGIGVVSFLDNRPVAEADPGNFLIHSDVDPSISVAAASVQVLKEMNPLVLIQALPPSLDVPSLFPCSPVPLELAPEELAKYHVVVMSGYSLEAQVQMNQRCRAENVKFFAANVTSACGHFFSDLLAHTYTIQPPKKEEASEPPPAEEHSLEFVSLEDALTGKHWAKLPKRCSKVYLALCVLREAERELQRPLSGSDLEAVKAVKQRIASEAGASAELLADDLLEAMLTNPMEHPAISAIVGGFLGQEVLKVVSAKAKPLQNFFCFDLSSGDGKVENMAPIPAAA